ncbi:hypothetical protein [Paenibacillus sp. 1P07SE]|uniref:hypothetical protein n=1 Tax=Paenibacillus sp. 1P07SE TaxID=3132209 RepID=UPI0039A674EB
MRFRIITILVMLSALLITSACGSVAPEEINGLKPSDIPVLYTEANIRKDYEALNNLLEYREEDLLGLHEDESPYQLETYGLTEWVFDDQTYYYLMEYLDPSQNDNLRVATFKIIRTEEGWKKERYGETPDFDVIVEKLNENMLRELSSP